MRNKETNSGTLVDCMRDRAKYEANRRVFTFLQPEGQDSISFGELHEQSRALARGLLDVVEPGDRAVLLCPQGLDYVRVFFACMYAGVVPVPLYQPRLKQRSDRVQKVLASCGATLVVTTDELLRPLSEYFEVSSEPLPAPMMSLGQLAGRDEGVELPSAALDDLAFIQYTSGSTGEPKGVMISHRNIMANLRAITEATGCHSDDVFVNWLPLFHDLGLINTVMLPVFLGAHSVLMTATGFVRQPVSWLDAISNFRGTICGAPNFAYELCAQKIPAERLSDIDLSSWRIAFNAAEPINPATLERFSEAFARCGFVADAFYPAYGMAEATVFLTGGAPERAPVITRFDKERLKSRIAAPTGDGTGHPLVACGHVPSGHGLIIVEPDSQQLLPDGEIGEIWVTGPSIAQGYWNRPALSESTFGARIEGRSDKYLRTGDLGFISNGEFYVSGRTKDIVIVRGQNYYPQDLELTAYESDDSLAPNAGVAFSVDDESAERLVLVQEVKHTALKGVNPSAVAEAIRRSISIEHELAAEVVLIRPFTLGKTSSGKVQRALTKALYLAGRLQVLHQSGEAQGEPAPEPREEWTPLQRQLADIWKSVLKAPKVDMHSDFFALGGDSLAATRLSAGIEQAVGVELQLEDLYENPTVKALAGVVERLQSSRDGQPAVPAIERTALSIAPLSSAQRRIWLLSQSDEQSKALNLLTAITLRGSLDIDRLSESIRRLVVRHEVLRTTYDRKGDAIFQYLQAAPPPALTVEDLQEHEDPEAAFSGVTDEEASTIFDLRTGPVCRIRLLRMAEGDHRLLFNIHHIAADAWSMEVFVEELTLLYNTPGSTLPDKELRYIDYAVWQGTRDESSRYDELKRFWQAQLDGMPSLLSLPYDRPRPVRQSVSGARYSVTLDDEKITELTRQSTAHRTTLFVTLLSAFQVVLRRLSGEADIVVGTDVANRKHVQLSRVFGFFVNQLVLRTDLGKVESFAALVAGNRSMLSEAIAHQDMPFDKLVALVDDTRDPGYSPLFQVKFLLNPSPLDGLALDGLEIEHVPLEPRHSQYDLTLSIDRDRKTGYTANFHYNTDLFDAGTIEDFAADYLLVLDTVARSKDIALKRIPCQQTSTRNYERWSHGKRKATETGLKESLERQVGIRPDDVAVVCNGRSLTYRELHESANRLAHFLMHLDIGSDSVVGVLVDRSIDQVVALLSLVKVGAAFLPLDPEYPADRIDYMLNDSQVQYVITDDPEHPQLGGYVGGIISLQGDGELFVDESSDDPDIDVDPAGRAYLLYTSGSTGRPKGVQVAISSLLNLCTWYTAFAELSGESRVLQPIPLSFDASIKCIFAPLMAGARLLLPPPGPFDAAAYRDLIRDHEISAINCVPSMFYLILDADKRQGYRSLASLRVVALGGESTDLQPLEPWLRDRGRTCKLANIYGPTECTDISVACKYAADDLQKIDVMPIGKPIDNVSVYVVDSDMSLVPPGVRGELLIAGAGVSLGYLGEDTSDRSKFIDHPFGGEGKLFRTGDIVQWDRSGSLYYCGREDTQVKVNGVRIETGEIERALSAMSGVARALVVKVRGRLVAFVLTEGLTPPAAGQMRDHLRQRLPVAYLPRSFVHLSAMPLLPNGKIDYQALYEMPISEHAEDRKIDAPESPAEQVFVDIFKSVLDLSKVGVNENFFELGGDSMSAVRVVSMAERSGIVLSVTDLFEAQTIRHLAAGQSPASPGRRDTDVSKDKDTAFDMLSEEDMSLLQ